MRAELLHTMLEESIRDGGDDGRDYLGMSGIWKCPSRLYLDLIVGRQDLNAGQRRRCHEGIMHQADVVERLRAVGVPVINPGRELVGPFDGRFSRQYIGHIDGEIDGDLLEIKTLEDDAALEEIKRSGPRARDVAQCQAYMRHGDYVRALVIYKARSSGATWVCWMRRDDATGLALERKAELVLGAIDDGRRPVCECGRCRGRE